MGTLVEVDIPVEVGIPVEVDILVEVGNLVEDMVMLCEGMKERIKIIIISTIRPIVLTKKILAGSMSFSVKYISL